jgi:hypothetical protein
LFRENYNEYYVRNTYPEINLKEDKIMEKHVFKTLIKGDHKLNCEYVKGRISGIAYVICEESKPGRAWGLREKQNDKSMIHTMECTTKQYVEFRRVIEELYPGLCIFDYIEPIC